MIPKLDTIGRMRIKLGITQKKLASMAGVSTSMINQIESNSCKPSYETARRIFDSLVTLEGSASKKKAGDVCSGEIVKIDINDKLDAAVSKMRKFSISQIPVFNKNALVGLVTEDGIMRHLDSDGDIKNTVVSSIIEQLLVGSTSNRGWNLAVLRFLAVCGLVLEERVLHSCIQSHSLVYLQSSASIQNNQNILFC